jgi:hypothetical protein
MIRNEKTGIKEMKMKKAEEWIYLSPEGCLV